MKEIIRQISEFLRSSFLVLLVLFSAALGIYRLTKLQIAAAEEEKRHPVVENVYTQVIPASRGSIVDCTGEPIVSNKIGYNLIIEKAFFPTNLQDGNRVILETAMLLKEAGFQWNDTMPVSAHFPYIFSNDRDDDIKEMKKNLRLNSYATAQNCIDKLYADYEIDESYQENERRLIAGIRYEMMIRSFSMSNVFYFANDIDLKMVTHIKELRVTLPGVNIVEEAIRTVENGDVLPHEIGYIGPIYSQEEYAQLKENGHTDYALSDKVGKSGLEQSCEADLRGYNGIKEITVTDGEVTSVNVTQEPVGGKTIQLTINSKFNAGLQSLLDQHCQMLRETDYECRDVNCGAIVVLDTSDNAVLGMATLPTYNLAELLEDYNSVAEQDNYPLINRATDGLYRPGSTFKTITATAGLDSGKINGSTYFNCQRDYLFIDHTFHCTGNHSNIDVSRALTVSCNIFFYELSNRLGLDLLMDYERLYGLGEPLGLESGDSGGYLACPETFEKLGIQWYIGELVQAGIGQSEIQVTPLQMATVASTIANEGQRYRPHLIDSYWNHTMTEQLSEKEPELVATVAQNNASVVYRYIEEGMIGAASTAMPSKYDLNNLGFSVAIKTGTPQSPRGTDSFVIGYAPAENPEIAFCAMVEGGKYAKYMVRDILNSYAECYPQSRIGRSLHSVSTTGGIS
ncbi:MAG: hypothetical protein MJ071_03240 [Oscillospiraceae bacterium]|nr:hypothetical protein [Oscillospiraceae bacterium]